MRHKRGKCLHLVMICLFSLLSAVSCSPGTTSSTEEGSYELTIDLPGTNNTTILANNQGETLKNAQITSSDGNISLSINKGTALLDKNGKPLQFIKVIIDSTIPVPPENAEIASVIVEIQPQGAISNPSLKLTLSYDLSLLPERSNEDDLWVYNYIEDTWEMVRYKQVDSKANRITTTVGRFGKYTVLAPIKAAEVTAPVSQPGLTSITLREALSNGKPTLAEFGRGTCIPCKEMKPLLENLAVEYKDRLNVSIISIDEYRDLTNLYKIMAIPTQICFDSNGNEVFRHVGFWSKDKIVNQLNKMGIN